MRIKEIVQQKLAPEIQSMVAKDETATVEVAYGNGAPGSVMPGIEGDSVAAKEQLMNFASGGEFNMATMREYRHGKMEARILLIILPEATKIRTKTGTLPTPPGYNIPMIRDRVSLRQVSMVNATDAMMDASDKPVYVLYDMYDVQQVSPGKYKFVDVHTGSLRRDESLSVSLLIQQALRDMGVSLAGRSDIGKLTPYFVTADGKPTLIDDEAAMKPCPQNVRIALLNTRANDVYNEVGLPFPAKPTFVPRDSAASADVVGGVVAYGGMMRKAPRIRDVYRGVNLTKYRFCVDVEGNAPKSGRIVGIPSMTAAAFREQGAKGFAELLSKSSIAGENVFALYVQDGESWMPVNETVKMSTFPPNALFCWSTMKDAKSAAEALSKRVKDTNRTGDLLVILTTSARASRGVMFSVQTDWTQSSAIKGSIVTKAGTTLGVLQRVIRAVVDGKWEFVVTAPSQFPRDLNNVADLTSKPHCAAAAVLQTRNNPQTKWLLLLSDEAYRDLILYVSRTGRMWRKQNPPVEGAIVPIRRTSIRVLDIIGVGDSVNISASLFAVDQDSDLSSLVDMLNTRRGDGHVTDPSAVLVGLYATTSDVNNKPIAVVGTGVVDVDRAVKNSLDISTVPFKRLSQVELGENYDNHVLIVMDAGGVAYYKRAFTVDDKVPRQIGIPMVYIPPQGFVNDVLNGAWNAERAKRCGDWGMMTVNVQLVKANAQNTPVYYKASVPRGWSLRTLSEASAHACALDPDKYPDEPGVPKVYDEKINVFRIVNRNTDVTFKRSEFDTQLQTLMSWGSQECDLIMYPENTTHFINYYVFAPFVASNTPAGSASSASPGAGTAVGEGPSAGGGGGGGGNAESKAADSSVSVTSTPGASSSSIKPDDAGMYRAMGYLQLPQYVLTDSKTNAANYNDNFEEGTGSRPSALRKSTEGILQEVRQNGRTVPQAFEEYSAYVVGSSANNSGLSTIIWSGRGDSGLSVHQIGVMERDAALVLVHDEYAPSSSKGLGSALSSFVIRTASFGYQSGAKTTDLAMTQAYEKENFDWTGVTPVLVPKIIPNRQTLLRIVNTTASNADFRGEERRTIKEVNVICVPNTSDRTSWYSRTVGAVADVVKAEIKRVLQIANWIPVTDGMKMDAVDGIFAVYKSDGESTTNAQQYDDATKRWTDPTEEAKKPLIDTAPKKKDEGELVFSGDPHA